MKLSIVLSTYIVRKLYPKQSAKQIVKMLLIKAKIMGV